jgi:cation transport ATPase
MALADLGRRKTTVIAAFSVAAIILHLILRFGFRTSPGAFQIPLWATLTLGGIPLVYELLSKLLKREFGSDLLAGISIVTSVLLGEYLAGWTRKRRRHDGQHEIAGIHCPMLERSFEQRAQLRVERMAEAEEANQLAELSPERIEVWRKLQGAPEVLERGAELPLRRQRAGACGELERWPIVALPCGSGGEPPFFLAHRPSISAKID